LASCRRTVKAKTDKLLTRLLVGVIKHQAKRFLGDDVVEALIETGSEYLGEELLDLLKQEASSRELAQKLSEALKSAAAELEREQQGRVALRLHAWDCYGNLESKPQRAASS
jgi:predicted ArsR family transcriptional regulator